MRVIAGEFRSRRLKSIPGLDTRPTPDRLRETLFDILSPRIENSTFLDAYAGTGAVGIEALSRGAAHAIFLEKSRRATEVIHENLRSRDLERRATVVLGKVVFELARHRGDIAFLDPPYELQEEYPLAMEALVSDPPPLVIIQHSRRLELALHYGPLLRVRLVRQGDNALSFYSPGP
jgi:16S rRNA (guanine(966)-N(2))-methyltransferase RsmD